MDRTKIVLDADVIIHFAKGDMLSMLPQIFTDHEFVVLDTVYHEIKEPLKSQLDNQIQILKNISLLTFAPVGSMLREFATLIKTLGRGESACMVYCRYHHNVIGSSNLKDIKAYCTDHQITYLTTIDFLYFAIRKHLITIDQAHMFVTLVKQKDSKLPDIDFHTFVSSAQL